MTLSKRATSIVMLSGILLAALFYRSEMLDRFAASGHADVAALVPARPQIYEGQKVVYHLHEGADWFGRRHYHRLTNLNQHLDALVWQDGQIVAVLAGDGLDLLIEAHRNADLGQRVDALRRRGVRFLICRNTMLARHIPPDRIHGFRQEDVVNAALPEIAHLEQQGYVYLKL